MTNPDQVAQIPTGSSVQVEYESLDEAFPKVNPMLEQVFGHRVLVQIRTPKRQTAGGIYVPDESRETELWNTQAAKVIALGPVAFHDRETLEPWPEGKWCEPGIYVRCPKYGGDRWQVPVPGSRRNEFALFVLFKDHEMAGEIAEEDVLKVVAFL